MNPLVPGVKVGEVLLGTRQLRRWLRAVELLLRMAHQKVPTKVYTPRKDDRFVVTVNAGQMFAVHSIPRPEEKNYILLPFYNFRVDLASKPSIQVAAALKGKERTSINMDASLFSKWFSRTGALQTKVSSWPINARQIWVLFQMNGEGIASYPSPIGFETGAGSGLQDLWDFSYIFRKNDPQADMPMDGALSSILSASLERGAGRETYHIGPSNQCGVCGAGPREKDIHRIETAAQSMYATAQHHAPPKLSQELGVLLKKAGVQLP